MTNQPTNTPDDDYQIWIDNLLTSPAAQSAAPSTLHHRIENQFRRRQRRSLIWKSALTLTAAASVAFIVWNTQTISPSNSNIALSVAPQSDSPPTIDTTINEAPLEQPPTPKATFVARGDMITIPIESNDPQVTIVQVYNTTLTHRRWQREAALQAINTQPSPQIPSHGG